MKYRIFGNIHWTKLPLKNPLIMGRWAHFEGIPEYETDNIDNAIKVLKECYCNKVYKASDGNGTEYILYYIVDENINIIAATDFDGNVLVA